MTMDLRDLYQEVILDHAKKPRNFRAIDAPSAQAEGFNPVSVSLQRAPAWTTDWISAEGKRKMREYGIAPPGPADHAPIRFVRRARAEPAIECPRCASPRTERLAAFGSTACKALHRCLACLEPFEAFKAI